MANVEDVDGAPLLAPLNVSEHGPVGLGHGTRAVYALRLRAAPLSGEALAVVVRPQTGTCLVSVAGEASAEVPVNGTFLLRGQGLRGQPALPRGDQGVGKPPAEVAFTATTWNQPQLVTLGVYQDQDSFAEGQHTGRIVHELFAVSKRGSRTLLGSADSVQVIIADDDAAGIELHGAGPAQPLTVWQSAPGAPSPAPQVYQVRLTSQPLATDSVSLLQSSTQARAGRTRTPLADGGCCRLTRPL